jgi:hypothetical protein
MAEQVILDERDHGVLGLLEIIDDGSRKSVGLSALSVSAVCALSLLRCAVSSGPLSRPGVRWPNVNEPVAAGLREHAHDLERWRHGDLADADGGGAAAGDIPRADARRAARRRAARSSAGSSPTYSGTTALHHFSIWLLDAASPSIHRLRPSTVAVSHKRYDILGSL